MIFPMACNWCSMIIKTEREFEEHVCHELHLGIEHTEKSILSEHYGLNESLIKTRDEHFADAAKLIVSSGSFEGEIHD